jgi:hypothetical protein
MTKNTGYPLVEKSQNAAMTENGEYVKILIRTIPKKPVPELQQFSKPRFANRERHAPSGGVARR